MGSGEGVGLLRRTFLCPLALCETFRTQSDDNGIWGECDLCGRRVGYVDRAALRRIADRKMAISTRSGDRPGRGGEAGT